jgi:hypothetical protein
MMGMQYDLNETKNVDENELTGYIEYAESAGLKVKIGG